MKTRDPWYTDLSVLILIVLLGVLFAYGYSQGMFKFNVMELLQGFPMIKG